jgi:hypothetical protein
MKGKKEKNKEKIKKSLDFFNSENSYFYYIIIFFY